MSSHCRRPRARGISRDAAESRSEAPVTADVDSVEPAAQSGSAASYGGGTLRSASARGFALSGAQFAVTRLLSLIGFAVLARLLTPHAYGLASLSYVFLLLFSTLAGGGFGPTLTQREHLDETYRDTTFWIALVTGFVLAVILCALSYPLALAFRQPQLAPVLLALSINFILIGLQSTPNSLLQRKFQFQAIAAINVIANIVATAIGVAFAFANFQVWALIIQAIVGPILVTVGLWRVSRYRPTAAFDRAQVRPIVRASRPFLGNSLMDFASQNTDNLLIGAVLGTVTLGIYSVAYRMVYVLMDVLANSVKAVAMPAFASLQSQPGRLRNSYTEALSVSASVVMPCFFFIIAAAPEAIEGVFGPKWAECVPVTRVLCVYGALESVMIINLVFLQSTGAAKTAFQLSTWGTILQIVGFAAAVPFGITWVAGAYVLRGYVIAPFALRAAARRIDMGTTRSLASILPPAICSALMCAAVLLLAQELSIRSDGLKLLALAFFGAASYALLLALLARDHFTNLLRLARYVRGQPQS